MKKHPLLLAGLGLAGALACSALSTVAHAQVAGTTARQATEIDQLAFGWSARKSILGKSVYTESGEKVGMVMDIIVDLDKSVSYLIVRAGTFLAMQRHDVAIPTAQLREQNERIVILGADRQTLKAMPAFSYASDTTQRDQFMARAQADIDKARYRLEELHKSSDSAAADAKAGIDKQIVDLSKDRDEVVAKLGAMRDASAKRWKLYQEDVARAASRLRRSLSQVIA